jgi:hypothetical protein
MGLPFLGAGPAGLARPASGESARRSAAAEGVLFCMVLFSGAYFYNGAVANQLARYDTIFAFVEPGTGDFLSFRIDRFVDRDDGRGNTIDWANNPAHDGHYYSNKAPGIAYLGIPVYALLYWSERALGGNPETHRLTYVNCYLLNLVLTVLPVALSAPCFYRLVADIAGGPWAVVLTAGLYFSTLMLPYSTQLWGHATAAALVIFALHFSFAPRPRYAWSGFFAGLGVLVEYAVAIPVAALLALLVGRRDVQGLLAMGRGGLVPAIAFGVYHRLAFGEFLTIANLHTNPTFVDEDAAGGLFRLTTAAEALWGITFSPFRGLFWHMPVLLAALAGGGLHPAVRRRPLFWISLATIGGFLLMNVSFNRWDGGACVGPRYQIPALPFYFVLTGLVVAELRERLGGRRWLGRLLMGVFGGLLLLSAANMLVTVSVSPLASEVLPWQTPEEQAAWRNPLRLYYEKFAAGMLQPHGLVQIRFTGEPWGPEARRLEKFILGQLLGLAGPWLTAPYLAILAGGLAASLALARRRHAAAGPRGSESGERGA